MSTPTNVNVKAGEEVSLSSGSSSIICVSNLPHSFLQVTQEWMKDVNIPVIVQSNVSFRDVESLMVDASMIMTNKHISNMVAFWYNYWMNLQIFGFLLRRNLPRTRMMPLESGIVDRGIKELARCNFHPLIKSSNFLK